MPHDNLSAIQVEAGFRGLSGRERLRQDDGLGQLHFHRLALQRGLPKCAEVPVLEPYQPPDLGAATRAYDSERTVWPDAVTGPANGDARKNDGANEGAREAAGLRY